MDEGRIKITFSRYCIGWGIEEYNRKPCSCRRCLTTRGEEVTNHTELSSKIASAINKYNLDDSVNKILCKENIEKLMRYTKSDLKNLINTLTEILNETENTNN